ncbi:hypothetical protein IVA87_22735 [Bradyrhizobium sp. 147]|uniref:hypothetical protein n=1 Tax=Bradyrhizobium sp. 147 TaxID=2782623 RepID=UPI001FF81B00|nr:hypothetical protein [Bradyrhizobium sp. 147]MCK1682155.1 hypothetical protein [Bradyrhizobium sp. 147]
MSTIAKLIGDGTLRSLTLGLLDDELPERGLFGTSRLFRFMSDELPAIPSRDAMLSAHEQVSNLLGRYLTNKPFVLKSPISPLRHLENGVWELKTLDVRVFGWFAAKDCMVIDSGCDVKPLKARQLAYSGFINQTAYIRKSLGFTSKEYIQGTDPNDILSKFVVLPRR